MTQDQPDHLEPSALGTKEYWDYLYDTELAIHASDPNDEGTIWFEDSRAEERILQFLETLSMLDETGENIESKSIRILDLGTGNGHLLFALKDAGWQGELVGVDYSERSVQLAQQIQRIRKTTNVQNEASCVVEQHRDILFDTWNVLKDEPCSWLAGGFDIVLDKGTFDAISLSQETTAEGQRIVELYAPRAQRMLKHGGVILVTSCNWTEPELRKWFEGDVLEYAGSIKFPSFTFGGVQGQTVSSVCFRRRPISL